MTFRYIGSKARLVDQISKHIGQPSNSSGFFVDSFCGTGAVAEAAALLGWNIRLNDHLNAAIITAEARLLGYRQVPFKKLGGYEKTIEKLNSLTPKGSFIWRTYSPASLGYCSIERRYFSEANASSIDSIREQIGDWRGSGTISEVEERLLIADLFSALNRVANIAGTFGCFLSKWTSQSQNQIAMRCRELKNTRIHVEVTVGDVFEVPNRVEDLVYLDPPYTKRQYASYYHILETVALGDEPSVEGVAGLRPWKDKASAFCYKTRALSTLSQLVKTVKASRILLSYSSQGHIKMDDMKTELSAVGKYTMHPLGTIGRYRPNTTASNASSDVNEYLVDIERTIDGTQKH